MKKKRVLMTNLYLQKYTGSELHTIEIARQFKKKGYEVTIVVYSKTYPLLEECEDFDVLECQNDKLTIFDYDIVYIQHFPVFDYLCCHYDIQYKYLIISKLSSFNDIEALPACYDKADLISVVSLECAKTVKPFSNRIFLFNNSVESTYFECFKENKERKLKRIGIISNHIPNELYKLRSVMNDIDFDLIGSGNSVKLVNLSLLQSYDLIITIGRTVQQCFASGVPVFVYDYFGGPGYINKENIVKAREYNFSGRGFLKMDCLCLKKSIMSGYDDNLNNLKYLHDYAKEHFSLDDTFNLMLTQVLSKKNDWKQLSDYTELEKIRNSVYTNVFNNSKYLDSSFCQESQLYFDDGSGFSENKSFKWNICAGYPIHKSFEFKSSVAIRFDPSHQPCKCRILSFLVDGIDHKQDVQPKNSVICENDKELFLNYDPQYNLRIKVMQTLAITYIYEPLNQKDYENIERILKENKSRRFLNRFKKNC